MEEFRRLLEKARKWDKDHPAALDEKKELLRKMADALGVEIDFV